MNFVINTKNLQEFGEIEIKKITKRYYIKLLNKFKPHQLSYKKVTYNDIEMFFHYVTYDDSVQYSHLIRCDSYPIDEIVPCILDYVRRSEDLKISAVSLQKNVIEKILYTKVRFERTTVKIAPFILNELFKVVIDKRRLLKTIHGTYFY